MKECTHCGQIKPLGEFHLRTAAPDGHDYRCRSCRKQLAHSTYSYKKKDSKLAQQQAARYLREYGLTVAEYEEMFRNAGYRCEICGNQKQLNLDHDHQTLVLRGILCNQCNQALGLFRESQIILEAALQYLKRPRMTANIHALLNTLNRRI